MSYVGTLIWFIEAHLDDDLSLTSLAAQAGVSPPHLARVFAGTTGLPVMRYVRRRRLARAVDELASDDTVLNVALRAGYASHEAFTRAFRAEFGVSPTRIQAWGGPAHLSVFQPKEFMMPDTITLTPTRLQDCGPRHFVGLNAHYDRTSMRNIPQQWERFNSADPDIPDTLGKAAYGVIHNFGDDGTWDYACAFEVRRKGDVPQGYTAISVPQATYAVFVSTQHITAINKVIDAAMTWIGNSDYAFSDGVTLERYGPEFDPQTGNGGFEVWCAVIPRA